MTPYRFIVATLALYRLAVLVTMDTGPFAIFQRLRDGVAMRWGSDSWQAEGVSCPLCVSWWFALPVSLLLPLRGRRERVLTALGMAGAVAALHKWLEG